MFRIEQYGGTTRHTLGQFGTVPAPATHVAVQEGIAVTQEAKFIVALKKENEIKI